MGPVGVATEPVVETDVAGELVGVVDIEDEEELLDRETKLYRERPKLPPQTSDELPVQSIEQRPSVAVVDPAERLLPQ